MSTRLTILTGILFLWQYPGAEGIAGHITRLALALFLSVFVVYMNTATVLNQPPAHITKTCQMAPGDTTVGSTPDRGLLE
jgi:hypothetical protein